MRSDKLVAHENPEHRRAVARYEYNFGPLKKSEDTLDESTPTQGPTPQQPMVPQVEPPLANLVRTVITVALSKSALKLVPAIINLQRANEVEILSLTGRGDGIQTFLHAAAMVLRRRQNARLRAAGMLSKMGDGSSDRKTIEQEIIYVRYPTGLKPITESLRGLRRRVAAACRSWPRSSRSCCTPRRCRPAADPTPQPEANSLHETHNLTVGSGDEQVYPSRLVTTALDGASVNLGEKGGVVALLKKEVPHVKGVHTRGCRPG